MEDRSYIPAAGHDWALPLYDPLVRFFGGDAARRPLLEAAAIQPGHRVLDVGCGTGTLAAAIVRAHPRATVVGIDPDPKALARARHKVPSIQLDRGFSDALPYPSQSFDRVVSSFVFHHLDEKVPALREIARVLAPNGELHLLDAVSSGKHAHHGPPSRTAHRLRDNAPSRVLELMREAGLRDVSVVERTTRFLGTLAYYRASP